MDFGGIGAGNLLVAASVIFSAGGFYYVTRGDNKRMRDDITDIKSDLKALNKVIMDVAVQDQRITNLEKRTDERLGAVERRWEEVRRGEGMIVSR